MDFGLYNAENPADGEVSTRDRGSAMQRAQSDLRGHDSSLAYLSALLEKAKSEIGRDRTYIGRGSEEDFSCVLLLGLLVRAYMSLRRSPRSQTGRPTT